MTRKGKDEIKEAERIVNKARKAGKVFESLGDPSKWQVHTRSGKQAKTYVNTETGEIITKRQFYNRKRGQSVESYTKKRQSEGVSKPSPKRKAPQVSPSGISQKEFAKKRGATAKFFETGKLDFSLPPTTKQVIKDQQLAVLNHRREAILFKYQNGVITAEERNKLMSQAYDQWVLSKQLVRIEDRLTNDDKLSNAERQKLRKEWDKLTDRWRKLQQKQEKYGIVADYGTDLYASYYHA